MSLTFSMWLLTSLLGAPVQGMPNRLPAGEVKAVRAQLQSADPREQAWGAWRAGTDRIPELIPLIQHIVAEHVAAAGTPDYAALDIALDALIQLEATLPKDLWESVYAKRRDQALILLSHEGKDADPFLLALTKRERSIPWFAASDMLLAHKAPGFAAMLLSDLTITATLTISDRGESGGVGGGIGSGSAGDGGGGFADGFPPWAAYMLDDAPRPGHVVLVNGPKPIYYWRQVAPAGQSPAGHTHDVTGPLSRDRLAYIEALLGIDHSQFWLRDSESHAMKTSDQAAIDAEVARIRGDLLLRFNEVVARFVKQGLLTDDEARTAPVPTITITIHEIRTDR